MKSPVRKPHTKGLDLTDGEAAYLRELRKMERAETPFTHREMCERFGWSSVQASFDYMKRLERKGFVIKGKRLAFVESPLVTVAGKQQLGERIAA